MGIFNFFIVLPEILSALGFGWVMSALFQNDRMKAVITGGICLLAAALLTRRIHEVLIDDASLAIEESSDVQKPWIAPQKTA